MPIDQSPKEWVEAQLWALGPVQARAMLGMRVFLNSGRMFAALGEGEVLLKLPSEVREHLLARGVAMTMPTGAGIAFGDWVAVALTQEQSLLAEAIAQSYGYSVAPAPKTPEVREDRRFRKRQY